MNNKKIRHWTRGEIQLRLASILAADMDIKKAGDVARLCFVNVVEPAIAEVEMEFKEAWRAKDNGLN